MSTIVVFLWFYLRQFDQFLESQMSKPYETDIRYDLAQLSLGHMCTKVALDPIHFISFYDFLQIVVFSHLKLWIAVARHNLK